MARSQINLLRGRKYKRGINRDLVEKKTQRDHKLGFAPESRKIDCMMKNRSWDGRKIIRGLSKTKCVMVEKQFVALLIIKTRHGRKINRLCQKKFRDLATKLHRCRKKAAA